MKRLTNENLCLAGAFNHKRHPIRRLAGPTTEDWRGIVAHAEDVLLDAGCLILIIAAAKPVVPEPCEHDILNARLSSLIFRKQRQFRRYKKLRIYLQDQNGGRLEIIPNLRATEKELRAGLLAGQRNQRSNTPIPSPLACFLLRQS